MDNQTHNICPKCGSPDTQSARMAYIAGTSGHKTTLVGVGDDSVAVLSGTIRTQTGLARHAAPPNIRVSLESLPGPFRALSVFLIGGFFAVLIYFAFLDSMIGMVLPLLVVIATICVGVVVYRGEKPEVVQASESLKRRITARQNRWKNTWICLRCGAKFPDRRSY
jgi:hypothetical protein